MQCPVCGMPELPFLQDPWTFCPWCLTIFTQELDQETELPGDSSREILDVHVRRIADDVKPLVPRQAGELVEIPDQVDGQAD